MWGASARAHVHTSFSLFCVNQQRATDRVCSTRRLSSDRFLGESESINWASSAYITSFPCGTCCDKSLENTRNNTGPIMLPCTTPCVTGSSAPDPPLTDCVRSASHARNHRSLIPYHPSFSKRRPCSTLSNALEVSAVTSDVTRPPSMLSVMWPTASSRAASVDWPGRNPYCCAQRIWWPVR